MIVSLIKDMYEPNVHKAEEYDLEDCYNLFKMCEEINTCKNTACVFTLHELKHGQTRLNGENVLQVHGLVLDFDPDIKNDKTPDIKQTIQFLEYHDLKYLLYTTHNHTNEYHRFRVILPFSSPIEKGDYLANCITYKKFFEDLVVDESSYRIAKHFKFPGPGAKYKLQMKGSPLITTFNRAIKRNYSVFNNSVSKRIQSDPKKYVETREGFSEGNRNNWVSERIYALQKQNVPRSEVMAVLMPYISQLSPTEQRTFEKRIMEGK